MPVEVSVVLTLVINKPLTGCGSLGLGCCIGERETCLPHRNRNSHSAAGVPVEVSIVLTLVINKPLTGPACWGLGCHIRERERHVCHTEIETHIFHAGVVSTCL